MAVDDLALTAVHCRARGRIGRLPAVALATVLLVAAVALAQPEPPKPPVKTPSATEKSDPASKARTDAEGSSLPDGAVARLGSARFRYFAFAGNTRPVTFSPDGKLLAITSRGVFLFEVATGRLLHQLQQPDGYWPQVVRFLADGKRIAVGTNSSRSGTRLAFFTLTDGKPAASPDFTGQRATDVIDVTADGSRALLLELGKQVYLWDLKAGRELWAFEHAPYQQVLPITPDGKWFAVTSALKADLRDADTGKVAARFPDPGRRFDVRRGAGLSPDGRITAEAGTADPAVAVLTARGPAAGVRTLPAEKGAGRCVFSPDSRYLVGAGRFGTQVWDLTAADDKGPVARLPAATTAGFSPDGKTLALAGEGFVALASVGDWKVLPQSADPPASVHRVRVTDDGRSVFGYTQQGWVRWPVGGGAANRPFASDARATQWEAEYALPALSADGRVSAELVSLGAGKDYRRALAVADAGGGQPRLVFGGVYRMPYLSPDGRLVASPAPEGVRVWDAKTGELLLERKYPPGDQVEAALPAPDGRGLARTVVSTRAGAGSDHVPQYTAVTVTDHTTGRTGRLNPVPWFIYDGTPFSWDGTRMISRGRFDAVSAKDTVAVWDARSGRRLAAWTGDYGRRDAMGLSADNRSFLVGDWVGRLTLVEVATGGERARFIHRGNISSAAFFPDGRKAVSSTADGPVYVWDLFGDPGKWDASKADAVWTDLASPDAKAAFGAIRKLRANPAEAITFLRDRVKLPAKPSEEMVAGLLRRLDGAAFADRERAHKELSAIAELVRPRLETARKTASEETRRRLDQVLKLTEEFTPEQLRQVRSCEVLEGIGTPEAIKLLRSWAAGPEGARLTTDAKESLARR
jgi:WD40 repeat protein